MTIYNKSKLILPTLIYFLLIILVVIGDHEMLKNINSISEDIVFPIVLVNVALVFLGYLILKSIVYSETQ